MSIQTPACFLPDERRQQIIAYLVQHSPQAASVHWPSIGDDQLFDAYNFARTANGLPAIVAPAPECEREP